MNKQNYLAGLVLASSVLSSCTVQQVALYDAASTADTLPHIGNFYSLDIWSDYINSEVWYTPDTNCLLVSNVFDGFAIDNGSLYLSWNKQGTGCEWVGMGIGWDAWSSKNISSIYETAGIQFMARSPRGTLNGLPWAMCLEDYSGNQAWAGVFSQFIDGNKITENWTRVQIPFTAFDTEQFDADLSIVKQLLIQFEADGQVYIDDIRVVPVASSGSKTAAVHVPLDVPVLDGKREASVWSEAPIHVENADIWIAVNNTHLLIYAAVTDPTPMQNKNEGDVIWQGDAIELAFSTNPDANERRKTFFLSDRHIGIRINNQPMVWDWRKKQEAEADIFTQKTETGYVMEALIPLESIDVQPFQAGKIYGLEIAVDDSDTGINRKAQYRWNNPGSEGFHSNPQLWGNMIIGQVSANK
jgi:hypothetical protein